VLTKPLSKERFHARPGFPKNEPKELKLANDAIRFFAEESASSVFVWSPARKEFEQVWLSD
jgi:hypothetical protein